MKLHLGCSDKRLPPPWVNCNAEPGPGVDRVLNVRDGMGQFPDASVDHIYTSHMVEHIEYDYLPGVFLQFRRVLVPGGLLTVATIDLMLIVENRYKKLPNPASWISAMYGDSWGLDRPFAAHKCCFDTALLSTLLKNAGFSSVRPWTPSQYPEIAGLIDCATRDRDVSLLLEGVA